MGNGETFSKFYVPPARREFNNIGLSTYFDWKFKVCLISQLKNIKICMHTNVLILVF